MSRLNEIPSNFDYCAAVYYDGYVYIFRRYTAYKYDIENDAYTQLANIPVEFDGGARGVLIDDCVYLISYYGSIKYNISTNSYSSLSGLPSYFLSGLCAVGTDIYVFGYAQIGNKRDAYKYDTLTSTKTKITDIPFDFYDGVCVSSGTDIYICGGAEGSNLFYKYDTLTDTYIQLANMPTYNTKPFPAIVVSNNIYFFGSGQDIRSVTAYKYNISTDSFSNLTSVPYSCVNGGIIYNGTDIYIFGGGGNNNQTGRKVQVYSFTSGEPTPKKGLWLKAEVDVDQVETDDSVTLDPYWSDDVLANIPYSFWQGGNAVSVGTDIYLFGGGSNSSGNTTAYKYDTLTNTYTQLTNIPYGFIRGAVTTIGTDVYLFGGSYDTNPNVAYKYDTLTDTYTQLTDIPRNFIDKGAAIPVGTDIYLIGGNYQAARTYIYNTLTDTYTQLSSSVYHRYGSGILIGTNVYLFGEFNNSVGNNNGCQKYDISTDTITSISYIGHALNWCSAVGKGTDIYIFSGSGDMDATYKYDTLTDTYTQLTDEPTPSFMGSSVLVDDDIYILGGDSGYGGNPTKVQVFTFPTKSYTNKTLVIQKGTTYETEIIDNSVINGLPYKFENFYYYTTTGGLNPSIEKYYGNGTNWIQIT